MKTPMRARTMVAVSLTLVLSLPGCSTSTRKQASRLAPAASVPATPLTVLTFTPVVIRGSVEVRQGTGASWVALKQGQAARRLRALRASGRGAMIAMKRAAGGQVAGKLWLRGGAVLSVGQTPAGVARMSLSRGAARISMFDDACRLALITGEGEVDMTGRDLLLQASLVDGSVRRLSMAAAVLGGGAADWTLSLLQGEESPAGHGTLSTRGARGAVATLELRKVDVQVKTSGDLAMTRVEHVFHNSAGERLEGTFRFPLPERASLVGLAMEIDGKLMEGELVERSKARKTYESIVDAMEDPALLEWEQGNIFKLRVFPIEPHSDKRVVLRYVAPLERDGPGNKASLQYRYDTAAAEMQHRIPRFRLRLDGKTIIDAKDFAPGRGLVATVPGAASAAMREVRKDGTYTALRVRPDLSKLVSGGPAAALPPRDLLLMVDTSRSALESRRLGLLSLRALLGDLRAGDRFLVMASDLTARSHAEAFEPATAAAVSRAAAFIEQIEPDGASDLGTALRLAGKKIKTAAAGARDGARRMQVVYLGDGTATWGQTSGDALAHLAADHLGEVPFHAVILGKGASGELLRRLASQQGGRTVKPRNMVHVQRLALLLSRAAALPRLRNVRIRAGEQDQVFPRLCPTLFAGEELVVVMRTPPGKRPPASVTLDGTLNGKPFSRTIPAAVTAPARYVAHRWSRHHLVALQAEGAPREALVEHSLKYGVMSKHTAFLVLESEEAYRRFNIKRRNKNKAAGAAPKVTGGDLESLGQARARLSPDHLQPGDPEVRIPAPADARSVVVVFPFGETKVASFEPALKAWTVRFLVAQDTPDGTYQITVRITHRDGRVELLRLSYVVDTSAPTVRMLIRKRRGRPGYGIHARQIVTKVELLQEQRRHQIDAGTATLAGGENLRRYASVVQDAVRVEVRTPSGKTLRLWPYGSGRFGAAWKPARPLTGPVTFRVVAVDQAYNRNEFSMTFDPATGKLTTGRSK